MLNVVGVKWAGEKWYSFFNWNISKLDPKFTPVLVDITQRRKKSRMRFPISHVYEKKNGNDEKKRKTAGWSCRRVIFSASYSDKIWREDIYSGRKPTVVGGKRFKYFFLSPSWSSFSFCYEKRKNAEILIWKLREKTNMMPLWQRWFLLKKFHNKSSARRTSEVAFAAKFFVMTLRKIIFFSSQ